MQETTKQMNRPKRKDYKHKKPNIGFDRTAHHEALEAYADFKDAESVKDEQEIKELKEDYNKQNLQHIKDLTLGNIAKPP